MPAMSTTEGPMVPSRTGRSVFLPDDGSSNSNFLSLIRLRFLGMSRGKNDRARDRSEGYMVGALKSRHETARREEDTPAPRRNARRTAFAQPAGKPRYSTTFTYCPGFTLPLG